MAAEPVRSVEPALALGLSSMLILAAVLLSGRNIVEGIGEGLSAAVGSSSDAAREFRDEM